MGNLMHHARLARQHINVAWECRHHRLFLGRTLHTILAQCIPISCLRLPDQSAPFFVKRPEEKVFPIVSIKFFRSNNGQWEIKTKIEGRGRRTLSVDRICTRFAMARMELISEQRHIKLSSLSTLMPSIGVISYRWKVKVTLCHHDNATLSGGCRSRLQL